ncbi:MULTISPECIES: TetR/AcrR family transcriptional regulator [Rhodococcus]|jgi:AcrR family transcriptional regulator|uniref:Possible transcriptional regulator n=1 Tax=Rhodococcus jostii (strain RHA1) TaxID=101510 RepID=Q0S695_RHOJR|nr:MULTISPECIES: TetR/AcrR family transcriptional regulator [Rhodococcus]ABG96941.1 possible transcriptional regulator [Rhodococcus jostii RHA1]EJI96020.1 transcriptional regulator, TetR family [Rhodococcus sp. JVH1]
MAAESGSGLRVAKKHETWRTLHACALDLVDTRGYDDVSVEEIAAAARVSKSTLFNYFESKEALLFDPGPGDRERWQKLADERPDGEPMWVSVREIIRANIAHNAATLTVQRRILDAAPHLAQSTKAAGERFQQFVQEWVDARVGPDQVDSLCSALLVNTAFAVLRTAYLQWQPGDDAQRFLALLDSAFAEIEAGVLDLPRSRTGVASHERH